MEGSWIVSGGITMPMTAGSDRIQSEEPVVLKQALFCAECEIIFAGTPSYPHYAGEGVWPLLKWVPPAGPGVTVSKLEGRLAGPSQEERPIANRGMIAKR
jgi:hypothetical protein